MDSKAVLEAELFMHIAWLLWDNTDEESEVALACLIRGSNGYLELEGTQLLSKWCNARPIELGSLAKIVEKWIWELEWKYGSP